MLSSLIVLSTARAGWCEAVYPMGLVASHPVVVTQCVAKDPRERFQAHWHGPDGRVTSSLVHDMFDYERILDLTLQDGTLRYRLDGGYTSTGNLYVELEAPFYPESGWFVPVQGWKPTGEVQARTRRGDWEVAGNAVRILSYRWDVRPLWSEEMHVLTALRDLTVGLSAAGRKREAADRVLGFLTTLQWRIGDDDVTIGDQYGWRASVTDGNVEVINDLGFVLEQGGAYVEAERVLRKVLEAMPERSVAKLNLADALWGQGKPEASQWYRAYVAEVKKPARWAVQRADRDPPPARATDEGARERYARALASGDLIAAAGAAWSGGLAPGDDPDWWRASAKEIAHRLDDGDLAAIPRIIRLTQAAAGSIGVEQRAALGDELWPLIERLSEVGLGLGWSPPETQPKHWVVRARLHLGSSNTGSAFNTVVEYVRALREGKATAVVGLEEACDHGSVCLKTLDGSASHPYAFEALPYASCDDDAFPCFVATAQAGAPPCTPTDVGPVCTATDGPGGPAPWHACGVDELGQIRCTGNDALAKARPPSGRGFWNVRGTATRLCAIGADDVGVCWTAEGAHQRYPGVADLAVGGDWTCVLTLEGAVRCEGPGAPVLDAPLPPGFLGPVDHRQRLGLLRR